MDTRVAPLSDLEAKFKNKTALVGVIGLGYVGLPICVAACEVGFRVLGLDVDAANPQVTWSVAVQRASGAFVTYWITVTNTTNVPVNFEGRYEVLGRWT